MSLIDNCVNEIREKLNEGIWKGTHKYKWIRDLQVKTKGTIAEKIYCKFAEKNECLVEKAKNTDHDCIVNGKKDEVKLSTMGKDGKSFTFWQIRQFQDYDNLVFVCIFPDDIQIWKMKSDDFMDYIEKNPLEQDWPGGKAEKKRKKNNIRKNRNFHWVKPVNKEWPKGARRM